LQGVCENLQGLSVKKRVTYMDRVPIKPIPRADKVFDHWFIDCAVPFFTGEHSKPVYNYDYSY